MLHPKIVVVVIFNFVNFSISYKKDIINVGWLGKEWYEW